MRVVSRAPTRICLAGGGTDVNPYAAEHGGAIVNVAIDRYHHVTLAPRNDRRVVVSALGAVHELPLDAPLPDVGDRRFDLLWAIISAFRDAVPSGFALVVQSDVSDGSGLGTSGSAAVALVGAFGQWVDGGVAREQVARLAFDIETGELGLAGGKQDQWAAAFGGLSFTRYGPGELVAVEPLACAEPARQRLRDWLLLIYAGGRRASAELQVTLQAGMRGGDRLAALSELAALADQARVALEGGDLPAAGELFHRGWEAKKRSNPAVTNERIDAIYAAGRRAGALGGKLIGAGGAGYVFFLCPPQAQPAVVAAVAASAAVPVDFSFDMQGLVVETFDRGDNEAAQ